MQVYVQQSMSTTLPFKPFIDNGLELAQSVISLNSGAGDAGISSISKDSRGLDRI